MQSWVAKALGLATESTKPLLVLVGNGEALTCTRVAHKIRVDIQGNSFEMDFQLVDLGGSNAVLGIQWLQLLGWILTDYERLTMKFIWAGKTVQLSRNSEVQLCEASVHQMRCLSPLGRSWAFTV